MGQCIGCDAHKKYSVFVAIGQDGKPERAVRVPHDLASYRRYLQGLPAGSRIALETGGTYYWQVEEIEQAGHEAVLAHALECRRRLGPRKNKTDAVDAAGIATLLYNGTLPKVWIPPAGLRDQRELLRSRMFLTATRTRLKNRIHGCLTRYNVQITGVEDVFSGAGRRELGRRLEELRGETRESVCRQLTCLDFVELQIEDTEARLKAMMRQTEEALLLDTLPRVGAILSMTMALEIGNIERFADAAHLASYSGLVPRVISSGGHTRMGGVSREVNCYLKWAFVEAGNLIAMSQKPLAGTHAVQLYLRVRKHKGHQKAVVAVGRHLAEAAFWVLKKKEPYREPRQAHERVFRPRTGKRGLPLAHEAS